MRLSRLTAVLAGSVLVAGVVVGGHTAAVAAPAAMDPAATYLMLRYGVDRTEADARLVVQDRAVGLQDALDAAFGDSYGGMWIDQAGGGYVAVGVLPGQAERARQLAAQYDVTRLRIVPVALALRTLDGIRTELQARVAGTAGLSLGGLYTPTNQVNLVLADGASTAARSLTGVLQREYGAVLRLVSAAGVPQTAACRTGEFNVYCDAPLRGGVGINANTSCSAAFNVRSTSDGRRFLLTAGHCNAGGTWTTRFANGDVHTLGTRHNSYYNSTGDAMIISLNNPSGWNPQPWVFVTGSGGTTRNEAYAIARDGGTTIGMSVCMTGQRDGTQCGTVIDNDTGGAGGVLHVAQVDGGCIRGGDSGGAVYRNGTAFGIVHGGYFPGGNNNVCSITWLYQGVRGAMAKLNVRLVTTSRP